MLFNIFLIKSQMAEVGKVRRVRRGPLSKIGPTGSEIYGVGPIMIELKSTRDEWI